MEDNPKIQARRLDSQPRVDSFFVSLVSGVVVSYYHMNRFGCIRPTRFAYWLIRVMVESIRGCGSACVGVILAKREAGTPNIYKNGKKACLFPIT